MCGQGKEANTLERMILDTCNVLTGIRCHPDNEEQSSTQNLARVGYQ